MPFLTAKAIETDPDGMAFLRAVIRPDFEREPTVPPLPPRPGMDPQPLDRGCKGQPDGAGVAVRPDTAAAVPAG